ncbi:MAG: molybdopterin-dependent oxidoreductase [Proteobacteria bacterium]|nr:molybdopterin-dependent oxidoreductase [Pseudomonadota bacterium]
MSVADKKMSTILWGLGMLMRRKAKKDPEFLAHLKKKNFAMQIKVKDDSVGRYFVFKDGKITSKSGIHPNPEATMHFKTSQKACELMVPPRDQLKQINAMKTFNLGMDGPDDLTSWFMEILSRLMPAGTDFGTDMGGGVTRYTNQTPGGIVFVYVKEGKILRVTPIDFDESDAESWTIRARGKAFTPPRRTTLSPYAFASKSMVYSPDRILYPMKRVDFDPKGERNTQNRGVSEYERISWDEALDMVADEIKRVKLTHGPGSILAGHGSHHTMGNLGYYLSSFTRFKNLIGHYSIMHNPDSWEGWYWGAMHHYGHSMHLGAGDGCNVVEDTLKECEMMVFWSSDPEATAGAYGAMEGTVRRQWLKELGVKVVHIDPYLNHTAAWMGGKWFAPRPGTSHALAMAIAYVWITEDLYDKDYVEKRTIGFDQWKDYLLGNTDGLPKTPEWQEADTLVPAKDVRALAREWASKKTYLGAGGGGVTLGGACRSATGIEWARMMVCLIAMQGLGKPGVNIGNLQGGTPLNNSFFFPGYAEGGFSGDLTGTALAANMYQRMPQLPSMNTVNQRVPRLRIPEAIMDQKTYGYPTDSLTIEGQFERVEYPKDGYAKTAMYYKYGGSHIGTMTETNRYAKQYQAENLEFVVNQSIWFEGETRFADVILPACTNFERWDIAEWANAAGYAEGTYSQLNHRVVTMQHKCIEPLGESKADYDIFLEITKRLGLSAMYSEGSSQLDWCKRLFDGTDLPNHISWKKFLKKGYYVVPPLPEDQRDPVAYRWYAEDRLDDQPALAPLPSDYSEEFGKGLQTQSGKIEFVSSSLKRFDPDSTERPPMPTYRKSWEGHHTKELFDKYPLQMISPHPRFSFHTMGDGKDSFMNDVKDHRVPIDGHYYWIARINAEDARERDIGANDLIKLYNDRGEVICAAQVTHRLPRGTVHSYCSSAVYDPIGKPGESADRGGCVNILTPKRFIIEKSHSSAANSCLIQVEKWNNRPRDNC